MLNNHMIATCIVVGSIAIAPTANASSWRNMCDRQALDFRYFLGRDIAPKLTTSEKAALNDWARKHGLLGSTLPRFPHELAVMVFARIPEGIRKKLIYHDEYELDFLKITKRLNNSGLPPLVWDSLLYLFTESASQDKSGSHILDEKVAQILSHTKEQRDAWAADIAKRVEEAKAVELLKNRYTAEYRIQVLPKHIVLPDGKRYEIVEKFADGTITINVRFVNFLKTEDFRSHSDRIPFYRAEIAKHPTKFRKGVMWYADKGNRSIGTITADGRYFIMDGHARSEAYSDTHNGNVLVDIQPANDGHYYAMTHYEVLNFYTIWQTIPEKERQKIQREARKSPLNAIREAYYRYLGRPRLN